MFSRQIVVENHWVRGEEVVVRLQSTAVAAACAVGCGMHAYEYSTPSSSPQPQSHHRSATNISPPPTSKLSTVSMTAPAVVRRVQHGICSGCLGQLARPSAYQTLHRSSIHTKRKLHGAIVPDKDTQRNMLISPQSSFHDYFSANTSIDRGWVKNGFLAAWRTVADKPPKRVDLVNDMSEPAMVQPDADIVKRDGMGTVALESSATQEGVIESIKVVEKPEASRTDSLKATDEVLPHRRRRMRASLTNDSDSDASQEVQLPLDASSQLTTAATSLPTSAKLRRKLATYLSLTKPRLSFLILLTTTSAYSLYPIPEILSTTATTAELSSTLSTSTLTLLFLTTGTFLSCACANTFNMLFEPKYDALMTRTRNRPLVRNLISRRAAAIFGILCGATGLLLLDLGTNPTVAALSGLNIFLYAGVYTPMKRLSWTNTWVGAIVGGIPPLMGWCAAAGEAATSEHHSWQDLLFSESSVGGWLLAALLFAWQFPHFNSLSHTIRDDYRNAGHKMLAWINPARNARVALRYSVAMFPICAGLYAAGIVNQGFLVISTVCNVWMTREAVKFWRKQGAGGSARGLFWASVWQLPLVLVGALVCKSGIWDGFLGKEEPADIYDEADDVYQEGDTLGMDNTARPSVVQAAEGYVSHNLAMLGFKRPS